MDYKYAGLELTARIMVEILSDEFSGKRFMRQEAIDYARRFHLAHGGICNKSSYISVFKAATRQDKRYESIGYGVWQINDGNEIDVTTVSPREERIPFQVDKTMGVGNESLYVYYYDTYKDFYLSKGQENYPCKIGMSKKENPLDRIIGQSLTAYPELPHIALVINCDDARKLEDMLHSVLNYKNKKMNNSPGNEWYMTNPIEIENIFNLVK